MAGRKGGRSSKTDHVLNLLSGGAKKEEHAAEPEEEKKSEEDISAAQKPQEEQQPAPEETPKATADHLARSGGERLAPPILQVARTNNEALAQTIRDALTRTLEEEIAQNGGEGGAAEPEPEPAVEPQPEAEAVPIPEERPALQTAESETVSESEPEKEPVPQDVESETVSEPEPEASPEPEEEPAPQDAEAETMSPQEKPTQEELEEKEEDQEPTEPFLPQETHLPGGAVCVNVMELLVDERLDRYVRMFGLCTCPRCLADARALALTRLPPKYVVMPGAYAVPMISLYRAKFESLVISQVIQACKTVMENPRHMQ